MTGDFFQRNRWRFAIAASTLLGLAAYLFWPDSKVELSERGYKVTLALYRVCNQRSVEGLAEIEKQLDLMGESSDAEASSHLAITHIVRQAKAGRWREAAIACRQTLDDQVH